MRPQIRLHMKQGHGQTRTRLDTDRYTVSHNHERWKRLETMFEMNRHAPRFGRIRTLTTIRHERGNRHRHRHCVMTLLQRVCVGVDINTS